MPKPKLTPEEKKELKKTRKEEKKRAAITKKRQLKIDHLEREIKYGQLTIDKHEKKWKAMLVKISHENIRKELDYAWHNFERITDAKDFTINLLMDEIKEAEEQYINNIRGHVEDIDKLIGVFKNRTLELKMDYERETDNMIRERDEEKDKMNDNFKDSEQYFKMMIAGLQEAKDQFIQNTMGDYIARINEEKDRYQDITAFMKTILQIKMDDIWTDIQKFIESEEKRIKLRLSEHNAYDEADKQMHVLIDEQKLKIRKSQFELKKLKRTYNILTYNESSRAEELLKQRKYYADRFYMLKNQLRCETKQDDKNLMLVSIESNTIIDYLKKIEKKGADILTIASVCSKYETEMEKVLPFPETKPVTVTYYLEDLKKKYEFNYADLHNFWQRVAQVDAIRYSMQEELVCLKKENQMLKEKIHRYCKCFNCPPLAEEVNKQFGKDGAIEEIKSIIIDATQEVKKYNLKERHE